MAYRPQPAHSAEPDRSARFSPIPGRSVWTRAAATKDRRSLVFACLSLLVVALGLWVSFHYAFATWGPDSDTAEAYVLWQGLLRDGAAFLKDFRYTADNWLLSPLPGFFLAFATVGDAPWIVVAGGWAIFVACAVVASLIVRAVAGTAAAVAVAVVLLLSNHNAIGTMGFLAFPLSHNASLLWGLVAVYATLRWLETSGWPWLAAVAVALFVADISDPWTKAAFTLPIGGAALWLFMDPRHRSRRRTATILGATVGAVLVVVHTKVFGLLGFLPATSIPFASAADRVRAFHMLVRLGGMWFNFLPGRDAADLWGAGTAETAANAALLLGGAGVAVLLGSRLFRRDAAFDALWLVATISCGVTTAAFLALDFPKVMQNGRYFMATYVLGVMVFGATVGRAWHSLSRPGRLAVLGYALLLPAAGLASGPALWMTAGVRMPDHDIPQFAAFLQAHGLDYGYGPYWDVNANAVAWVTEGAIVVRPVAFDPSGRAVPRLPQTSPRWYSPADVPPGQRSVFLVMAPGDDGCRDIPACVAMVERQFGQPREILRYGDMLILVWDYAPLGVDPDTLASHVAPLPVGVDLDLTSAGIGAYLLGKGWAQAETIGTWTDGKKADVLLRLPPGWAGPARVTFEASAFVSRGRDSQELIASVAGRRLARWKVSHSYESYTVTVPGELLRTGSGVLQLETPDAISPRQARAGTDVRVLGINARALRVEREEAAGSR